MKPPLAKQLLAVFFFKLLLNTGRRFVYPFAPALSRGLEVPLAAVTTIIAAGQFSSLLGLFSGPAADRIGNRFMMRSGLALLAVGMLLCGIVPQYWFVFTGLILASFGKTLFDPAIQSFIGSYVPFERRGRAIGAVETAWAGSTLIGIPALGLIIDHLGLRASFFVLGLLGGVSWLLIAKIIPEDNSEKKPDGQRTGFFSSILKLFQIRAAAGMLAFGFWISIANDCLFVVYGIWFEQQFMVSLVMLGFSTVAIGGAELLGESITAIFSDRLGLKRTLVVSLSLVIVAYFLLPFIGVSLSSAMVGMFLVFLFFETTIVTSFSLSTELMPGARATMMAGFYATSGVGRMLGVLIGSYVWELGGIKAVSWGAAGLSTLGLVSLLWGLKGWKR
ncbi:MAG: MFS transporter [Desulfobulbaceae bacterium]|nr:MFS transporter [Desulfobulbaceae bacterium]